MTEYAYTQNDNEIIAEFNENSTPKDLSGVTKIKVELFGNKNDLRDRVEPVASHNTVDDSSIFDISDLVNGNLTYKPDSTTLSTLTAFRYFGRFVVFSTDYPNGIIWAKSHEDLFEFIVTR